MLFKKETAQEFERSYDLTLQQNGMGRQYRITDRQVDNTVYRANTEVR